MKWVVVMLLLSMLLFSISCFFLKKEPLREMKSMFESGVDQNEQENSPFYMHFFYVGILFLIFDVELILCIPMIQSILCLEVSNTYWLLFFTIVVIGLFVEVKIDSVEWKE